jgi:hypothetical protein
MADAYFLLVCDDVPHDVVLTDPGVRLMDVVQVVRGLTGLSLWRSKVLATRFPPSFSPACQRRTRRQPSRPSAMRGPGQRRENSRSKTS